MVNGRAWSRGRGAARSGITLLLAAVAAVTFVMRSAPDAQARDIDGLPAELVGSGWAACPAPIDWVVDTSTLTQAQAGREIARLSRVLGIWSSATGLQFHYAGQRGLELSGSTLVSQDGSPVPERTILIAFINDADAPMLDAATYGYASPSLIKASNREIVGAYAVLRADLAREGGRVRGRLLTNLYLHELGHALGVGHVREATAVMNPVVRPISHAFPQDLAVGNLPVVRPCLPATV